jgi:hypothetical protein
MLSAIRNKIKGWIAYTIIALIIVPFALFGVNEYSTGTNIVVASVNGEDLSKEEFLRCVNINNHSKPAFRLFGIFFKLSLNSVRVRFKKMTV